MAYQMQMSCDNCGKKKQETNHWVVLALEKNVASPRLWLGWLEAVAVETLPEVRHYCGRNCALQAISRFLDGEGLERTEGER